MESAIAAKQPQILLPEAIALAVNAHHTAIMTPEGELETLSHDQAALRIHKHPVLLCHAPYIKSKIDAQNVLAFDILELFAFVHPATFCVPTPAGLCKTLGLTPPQDFDDTPMSDKQAEIRPQQVEYAQTMAEWGLLRSIRGGVSTH